VSTRWSTDGCPTALLTCAARLASPARAIYALWADTFGGSAFSGLRAAGASAPWCLWASTGNKNPAYRDVRYVESLIGPMTVNTVPDATLAAFVDHGEVQRTLDNDLPAARALLARCEAAGIDLDAVGETLQADGLRLFEDAFDRLLRSVA